ncbi:MAG: hypothetical protein ACFFG0_34085 [Candidatus Thorarchaeota archaeon]
MKLNRLKSIVNQVIRTSAGDENHNYMIDPFYHFRPKEEYIVDLLIGTIKPETEGDDIERYYKGISLWFREVLPKEGINPEVIDKAILTINPKGKFCVIEARGRQFRSKLLY